MYKVLYELFGECTMLKVKHGAFGALWANNYLITDTESGECALVDCSGEIDEMLRFVGSGKLKYILLTHGHFDHACCTAELCEKTGAIIVIGEGDAEMSHDTYKNLSGPFGFSWREYTPNLTVKEGDVISLGNSEISVISTPGHTPGCVCYITDDSIFTGDTIMVDGYGRTDFPGGNVQQLISSLRRLEEIVCTKNMYPGHGDCALIG